uniref:BAR domain-containing protein n=1 Tax=Panagrellus redivivus TaxID=6233 RepID=A0A7E4UU89_PANRE
MFFKVKTKVLKSARKHEPELEVPVVKRIQQLNQVNELAHEMLKVTKDLMNMFDETDGPLKNSYECYGFSLKILGSAVKANHPEYTTFLEKQNDLYGELGHCQRIFQYNLNVKVISPLTGWITSEYERINKEVRQLYDRKNEFDHASRDHTKEPQDVHKQLQFEIAQREYDRQLEITKMELLRLSGIKAIHAQIYATLGCCIKDYTLSVVTVFNKASALVKMD